MNTRAESVTDPEKIRSFLVDQIVGMVRWRETINYMNVNGVSIFYEIGVGKVLSGMVKRISNGAETVNVASIEDIKSLHGSINSAKTSQ
jgi:[acyl-carrier-protein] S-malonyltransferase